MRIIFSSFASLILISGIALARAQEVSIPDPGLNAAVREALQKPSGPLTEQDLLSLTQLNAGSRSISNVAGLEAARNLLTLDLHNNWITNFDIVSVLTNLTTLFLEDNQLTNISFSSGLNQLVQIDLSFNQLTSLTLPEDMTNLTVLDLDGNPFAMLVLSEPLAATNLASTVAALRAQFIPVFVYPLTIQLTNPRTLPGAFHFDIIGPPGLYTILGSTDLANWSVLEVATNSLGFVRFDDPTAPLSTNKFYRASSPSPH